MTDAGLRDAALSVQWSPDRGEKSVYYLAKMEIFLLRKDEVRARTYADSAVAAVTPRIRERPEQPKFYGQLASAQVVLGHKTETLAALDKARSLQPLSKDRYSGTDLYVSRAISLMRIGESDQAIDQLDELLKIPSSLSRNALRLDPTFDSLRGNPRFQKLLAGS